MDRDAELDAFKAINLSVIASAHGYEIDRKKSTRHSVLMASGADKIIISQNGGHYVYCSVHDPASSGTVIDFVQRAIEPGCSLGRVRQILRPFLGNSHLKSVQRQYQGRYQSEIRPSEPDFVGVAARYARFEPMDEPHAYLCEARGIPFDLLQSKRLHGHIRHCPRRGSIVFPHWMISAEDDSAEPCLTGYEIKGRGVNLFSRGGRKGLWISARFEGDRVLAVAESGLDAVSYLAMRREEGVRVCSISGQMNPDQPAMLRAAIQEMQTGSQIVAAFDNDRGGDELTKKLGELMSDTGRSDLEFRDHRPEVRGHDWNRVLVDEAIKAGQVANPSFHIKR